MGTHNRRTFLKQSAMLTAAAAASGAWLPFLKGQNLPAGISCCPPATSPPQTSTRSFFAATKNSPEVIAHRGGDLEWPGETMYAMRKARDLGVDVLEMDVYLTRDRQLVLMHDNNVGKTTEAECRSRKKCRVYKFSSVEIQKLNAAYNWKKEGGYPHRKNTSLTVEIKNDIRVPSLREVFCEFPEMRMVIEMKLASAKFSPVEVLRDLIRECRMQDKVLVASLWTPFMHKFRELCPEVATSVTFSYEDAARFFGDFKKPFGNLAKLLGKKNSATESTPLCLQLPHPFINEWVVNRAKEINLKLHAWTVNKCGPMDRMKSLGVDGIITDRPTDLLRVLGRPVPAGFSGALNCSG